MQVQQVKRGVMGDVVGSAFTLAQQSRRVHAAGSCKALDARMLNYHRMRCCGARYRYSRCTMADAAHANASSPEARISSTWRSTAQGIYQCRTRDFSSGMALAHCGVQWCAGTTCDGNSRRGTMIMRDFRGSNQGPLRVGRVVFSKT
jgi:hypothetical protein